MHALQTVRWIILVALWRFLFYGITILNHDKITISSIHSFHAKRSRVTTAAARHIQRPACPYGRHSYVNEVRIAAGCRNATRDRSRDYSLTVTDGASWSEARSRERACVVSANLGRVIADYRRFEAPETPPAVTVDAGEFLSSRSAALEEITSYWSQYWQLHRSGITWLHYSY